MVDTPGGAYFKDVTELFLAAAEDLESDEMVMADGYTLFDAMSALEIGDPRMDTGAPLLEEVQRPEFEPLTPLLPEEVCWILDRMFACEITWHAGYSLSQTVHTCLYMHHLESINPIYLSQSNPQIRWSEDRPQELVSLLIRAGTLGMIKCCDMAYRELVKGNVNDGEDWQGEKAEVSLYEGTQVERVIQAIEVAEMWLNSDPAAGLQYRTELLCRITLRKIVLKLFVLGLLAPGDSRKALVSQARELLEMIQSHPVPSPKERSPALTAFDPYITRKLHSTIPVKPVELPSESDVWISLTGLLDGWDEIVTLASCQSLLAWDLYSNFRATRSTWAHRRIPYLRSAYQSLFSDGHTVLDRLPYFWLVDQFFSEITHISVSHLNSLFGVSWRNIALRHPFELFQDDLSKIIVQHIWAAYQNRPRQRRHLMKTVVDWHSLYDVALTLTSKVVVKKVAEFNVIQCVPLAVLQWRLVAIRDIVLSGFELELYSFDELPFAYWYLSQTLDTHEQILRRLHGMVPHDSPASNYLDSQAQLTGALRWMSTGMYLMLCGASKFNAAQRWANFYVRYKWATSSEYSEIRTRDAFGPDFRAFLKHEKVIKTYGRAVNGQGPEHCFVKAAEHLTRLVQAVDVDFAFQLCKADFLQYQVDGLLKTCEIWKAGLSHITLPLSKKDLEWVPDICPWYPQGRHLIPESPEDH